MYGTARAELLCTCVARVRVQTLAACICRSAYAVAWRRRLPPYLESPPACDRPTSKALKSAVDVFCQRLSRLLSTPKLHLDTE